MSRPFVFSDSPPAWQGADENYPEGNLGARFGDLVVSTPNASVMYAPLCNEPQDLLLREGVNFGLPDPTVHPQVYAPQYPNLPCMLTPTRLGENAILFYRIKKSEDWETTSSFQGLGSFTSSRVRSLCEHAEKILDELERLVKDASAGLIPSIARDTLPNPKTTRLTWLLKHYMRLLGRQGTFEDCLLRWANTQRFQLDIRGIIDFLTIFRPLLRDPPLIPRPVDHSRMGCITHNFNIASELYAVGLPVWYVYKAKASMSSNFRRFLAPSDVAKLLQASSIPPRPLQMGFSNDTAFISLRRPPDYVLLWRGPADDPARFTAMSEVLRGERLPTTLRPMSVNAPASANVSNGNAQVGFTSETAVTGSTSAAPTAVASSASMSSVDGSASSSFKRGRLDSIPAAGDRRKKSKSSQSSSGRSSSRPSQGRSQGARASTKQGETSTPGSSKSNANNDNATAPAGNRSRWVDVVSRNGILPAALQTAANALEAERLSIQPKDNERPEHVRVKIPGVEPHHSLFAAPDGGQIASMDIESTQAGALANYARFRPLILHRVRKLLSPATSVQNLRAQDWRTILGLEVLSTRQQKSLPAGKVTVASTNRSKAFDVLRESMREAGSLVTFHLEHIRQWDPKWLGENFSDNGRLPPLLICRQMIWEMYELNFRSELILLDHFVFDWAGQQQKDEDERLTPASRRSLLVSRMEHWDGDLATVDEIFIYYSAGLCSSDREARVCAVRELLTTMSEWVGVGALGDSQDLVPRGQALLSALTTVPLEDILAWEELCWRHYIRTFYRVFGRPPTLPRMMPLHDDTEEDVLI